MRHFTRSSGIIGRGALILSLALAVSGCSIFGGDGDEKKTPTIGKRIPILGVESDNKADPALNGVAVIVPVAQANPNWAQPGGNAAKAMGHVALPATLSPAWNRQIAGSNKQARLAATPVVSGGQLFAIDIDGTVHAFDALTGAPSWSRKISASNDGEKSVFGGGVAVEAGRVYATNGAGDVEALSTTDGSSLWKVRPAGPLRGAPTLANGNVYVMTQDNQIYALAQATGKVNWTETGSVGKASIFGVAAPAAAQATVVAGYSTGELTAYRFENGQNLWADALSRTSIATSVSTLTDIDADPVIDNGRVYAVGQGGRMAAYELVTGQRIWELNIASISTPAVAGEWVFVLTNDAKVMAVARGSGRIRWIADLPAFRNPEKKKDAIRWTGPVLAGGRLIVANSEGQIVQLALADGAMTPLATVDAPVSLPPIVAGGMLYILDESGQITAMR